MQWDVIRQHSAQSYAPWNDKVRLQNISENNKANNMQVITLNSATYDLPDATKMKFNGSEEQTSDDSNLFLQLDTCNATTCGILKKQFSEHQNLFLYSDFTQTSNTQRKGQSTLKKKKLATEPCTLNCSLLVSSIPQIKTQK